MGEPADVHGKDGLANDLADMLLNSGKFVGSSGKTTNAVSQAMQFTEKPQDKQLLQVHTERQKRASLMSAQLARLLGLDGSEPGDKERISAAHKLVREALRTDDLADEVYAQLFRQCVGNPERHLLQLTWRFIAMICAVAPPSDSLSPFCREFVRRSAFSGSLDRSSRQSASRALTNIDASLHIGPRHFKPLREEIEIAWQGRRRKITVHFLDGSSHEVEYGLGTTVDSVKRSLATDIGMERTDGFELFATWPSGEEESPERQATLDAHSYLADAVQQIAKLRFGDDTLTPRGSASPNVPDSQEEDFWLVFKKALFRDSDLSITDPLFIRLCFVQEKAEFLRENYPVDPERAAHLAALIFIDDSVDWKSKFTRSASHDQVEPRLLFILPAGFLRTKGRPMWTEGIVDALKNVVRAESPHEARQEFLLILSEENFGNCVFFHAEPVDDPIRLLPGKVTIGVNCHGMHFFRPKPKEYIYTAWLTTIRELGSNENTFYVKMKVAGEVHPFSFSTEQGEEIKIALQAQIEDRLSRRRFVKGTSTSAEASAKQAGEETTEPSPAAGESGKNEINELKRSLDEKERERQRLQSDLDKVLWERDEMLKNADVQTGASELVMEEVREAQERAASAEKKRDNALQEVEELKKRSSSDTGGASSEVENLKRSLKEKEKEIADLKSHVQTLEADLEALKEEKKEYTSMKEKFEEMEATKSELEQERANSSQIIKQQREHIADMEKKYKEETVLRKKYWNMIQEMKGKVRVYARVRPAIKSGENEVLSYPDEYTVTHSWKEQRSREYTFDRCFSPSATQEQVFEDVRHLVQSAMDGYNVCIFAYGQTGSGKTHTIHGTQDSEGITPRAIRELFAIAKKDSARASYEVGTTMLELYQDTLMDLLAQPSKAKGDEQQQRAKCVRSVLRQAYGQAWKAMSRQILLELRRLEIKRDAKTGWVTVQNASEEKASSVEEVQELMDRGLSQRKVAHTKLNTESSRSHLIFTLLIRGTDRQTQATTRGKLSFVDLAGSERVKKSGSGGEQLKEAQAINKSLSALGDVISSLASDEKHVPYRNHKLTMLMSDSLGGNAKTLMFVNVSPAESDLDETANSLSYASRARNIKNTSTRNQTSKEVERLRKQVEYWKAQAGASADSSNLVDISNERQSPPAS